MNKIKNTNLKLKNNINHNIMYLITQGQEMIYRKQCQMICNKKYTVWINRIKNIHTL